MNYISLCVNNNIIELGKSQRRFLLKLSRTISFIHEDIMVEPLARIST